MEKRDTVTESQVTVHDVARRAGVSIKTVSRVINKEPNVRAATQAKVEDAMKALGYRRNFAARRLRLVTSQSFLIGLIYDDPRAGYISDLLIGTLEGCNEDDYRLALEQVQSERQGPRAGLPSLVSRTDLDGVILTQPLSDDMAIVRALLDAGQSVIRIVPYIQPGLTPRIFMDDEKAAYDVTRYLLDIGHRRIAHIKGHPGHGSAQARVKGFLRAMKETGLEVPDAWMPQGQYTYQSGMDCTQALLASHPRPTAIFAANDEMALAALMHAQAQGLHVPADISIAGIDDAVFSSIVIPGLTTVRPPLAEMAEAAARMLIALKSKGPRADVETSQCLPYDLVVRNSTAPPPTP